VLNKAMILLLALCFSSVANAQQLVEIPENWLSQAELVVAYEESRCELMFDTMPTELFLAQGGCCRTCSKGKACGNACINRDYTCRQPRGCACDG
jgi:hypothetical protein